MTLAKLEPVNCPFCGKRMGFTAYVAGSEDLSHSLYMMAQAHKKSCEGVGSMSRKKKSEAMAQEPVQEVVPEVQPEITETHPDVIVAQALEAKSEEQRGDSEEQTAMEALAGVAPRKGRLQKGDYPVWLQKINAQRLEARNARLAEKAAAKEAKKAAKA